MCYYKVKANGETFTKHLCAMHDLLYQNIMQYHDLFKKYTKITEVNLSLFVKYRYNLIYLYLSNTDKLSSVIFVYKAHC